MDQTAIQAGPPPRTLESAIQERPPVSVNGTAASHRAPKPAWLRFVEGVASLRFTVWLFVLSLFIVFYGTWAQVDEGIWYVVRSYFRSWFVWIPIKVLMLNSIDSSPFSVPFF